MQGRWEEWQEARQMQEVEQSEKEGINRWMEVIQSEQKTGQKQWTHLPHEQAAVRRLDHHSRLKCCQVELEEVLEGRVTLKAMWDEGVATEVQNVFDG